jgi:hypothetical protein
MLNCIISLFIFLLIIEHSIIISYKGSEKMIGQNQIGGQFGETLLDDIKYLKENSMKLIVDSQSVTHDTITTMTDVFNVSSLIDDTKNIILSCSISIKNTSTTNFIDFQILDGDLVLHEGRINPDMILSFSSDKPTLSIKVNGNCVVNYTIKYF